MTSGAGATFTSDESNRVSSATEVSGGTETYFYAPDNKRVCKVTSSGTAEIILYGVRGEQLGVFAVAGYHTVGSQNQITFNGIQSKIWFAGKLIWDYAAGAPGPVYQDRLQTNRASGARFYPYGDEITSTSNDREKFATYTRDSYTGLDYADQRYCASAYGRFNTPDPYMASAKGANDPNTPQSWNRYAYVQGDPINFNDRQGLAANEICTFDASSGDGSCDGEGDYDNYIAVGGNGTGCTNTFTYKGVTTMNCYGFFVGSPVFYVSTPQPTCEQAETAYVASYLSQRNSPLAVDAAEIVQESDAAGIDDRFIVALAGAEISYGKMQQNSPTWGYYNAFSNASHCQALSSGSDCYAVNPYMSYDAAISDAISLLTGGKYFGSGLTTVGSIYKTYNRVPAAGFLAGIYQQLVPGATVNSAVNFSRCP